MYNRTKLFLHKNVYSKNTDDIFFGAVRENIEWHISHCVKYARLLETQGFTLQKLKSYEDIYRLPPIPTLFLKKHELFSMPLQKIHMQSTTSGTSGTPVKVGFDKSAMLLGLNMLRKTFFYHKMISAVPTNYIVLGYEPSTHNHMGAVRTAYAATLLAPPLHREYALKDTGTEYVLNEEGVLNALITYSKKPFPVRINGFPAYLYFLVEKLKQEKIRLSLHPKSLIFLGGGWKKFAAQKVDKQTLYKMAEEQLGIAEQRFHEFFGVVEHNVPYCDCKNHHFHVPVYSRVLIRDIHSLEPLPYGKPGLLNLITPLLKSMPLTSILTDDIAVLHRGEECGCGISAPYFEVLGRAGLQGIKTCAAGAGSMLEELK
ncbi:acyl-protein synthetase [Christensenellaceae bacterium OttesenSCG-928-K19]|nr:acyl-protein synthetase [Christensenellaceae bacterium OttesenSCG-928-K19]